MIKLACYQDEIPVGRPKREILGEQDLKMIRLLAEGHSKKSVAVYLGTSQDAISRWLRLARYKVKARTDIELVATAMKKGLIS